MTALPKPATPLIAILCDREFCPVETTRKAIRETRARWESEGVAKPHPQTTYSQCMSCTLCGKLKCWKRYGDGTEIETRSA